MEIGTLKLLLAGATSALLLMLGMLVGQHQPAQIAVGSVNVSNDYIGTTTSTIAGKPSLWSITATSSTDTSMHTGTFGSFVQTKAGGSGGNINIYDATTSDATKRAASMATSSILLASLPTDATVGTYTFDIVYKFGLLVGTDGTVGTTTITYRLSK